jgi:exodeoxyribonuclease VII small subunit
MAKKKARRKTDKDKLSFEQAIENLTEIVDKIETGQVSLADSLSQYEKGMELIRHCRKILLDAEKRIEKITEDQQNDSESDDDEDNAVDVDETDEADDTEDESLF